MSASDFVSFAHETRYIHHLLAGRRQAFLVKCHRPKKRQYKKLEYGGYRKERPKLHSLVSQHDFVWKYEWGNKFLTRSCHSSVTLAVLALQPFWFGNRFWFTFILFLKMRYILEILFTLRMFDLRKYGNCKRVMPRRFVIQFYPRSSFIVWTFPNIWWHIVCILAQDDAEKMRYIIALHSSRSSKNVPPMYILICNHLDSIVSGMFWYRFPLYFPPFFYLNTTCYSSFVRFDPCISFLNLIHTNYFYIFLSASYSFLHKHIYTHNWNLWKLCQRALVYTDTIPCRGVKISSPKKGSVPCMKLNYIWY